MTTGGFTRAGPPTPRTPYPGIAEQIEDEFPEGNDPIAEGIDGDEETELPGPDRDNAERLIRWADPTRTPNIAKEILEDTESFPNGASLLDKIGQKVVREYEIDEQSRTDWLERSRKAMELAMQVAAAKTNPWEGASNFIYPLISSAAVQFAARAMPALVPGPDIVKGQTVGRDDGFPVMDPQTQQPMQGPDGQVVWQVKPGAKRERADRIAEHMSWQFVEEQTEWYDGMDKLTLVLPIVGCCFKKTYYDPLLQRNVSSLVLAEDLVINYYAESMETAPRITEKLKRYPYQILEEEAGGTWLHHDYGMADGALEGDEDAPHDFLEQQRRWDIDDDGYPEPYLVTVHKATAKVVRIVADWDPDGVHYSAVTHKIQRIQKVEYHTKYDFMPNPDGGIYGVGLGTLLQPINDGINTTLNQMFDAGTLQNMGGGFVAKGLSMQSGALKYKMGEYKVVNVLGSTLKDSILPLQHNGPSTVLFELLGFLVDAGKELAANAEVLTGQQTQSNVPATTTMALIEQGLNVFKGIFKRIYRSLTSEFKKQYRLNRLYLNKDAGYLKGDEWKSISQDDYTEHTGVVPIADPNMVTDLQQFVRAEALKQTFFNDFYINQTELRERILDALHIQDKDKLIYKDPMQNPMMMFRMNEMALAQIEGKSKSMYWLARGVQALALADKAVADAHLAFVDQHYKMLEDEMDRLNPFPMPQQPGQPPRPEPLLQEEPPLPPFDPPGAGHGVSQTGSPIENVGEAGLTAPRQ